jgi:hypothetical protein
VIGAEVELVDIDARHWRNWWRLTAPPRAFAEPRWALAIVDGAPTRPVKVIVAGADARGAVEVAPYASLAELSRRLGVAATIALDKGVIRALSADIEAALQPHQDGVAQALVALRALKRRAERGIWTDPAILDVLPTPGYEPIQRTFDLLVPNDSALAAYVIDDDRSRLHASIIAVKRGGDIVHVTTHRALAGTLPEASVARDWQTAYGRVNTAIERALAKPSIAVYLERATWQRIVTGPSDQLARELDAKRLIIDPAPTWLLGLLSGAAVAAMAGRAASAIANVLPTKTRERAAAIAQRAQTMMKDSGAHPFALLGFDPIELWHRLRHFYRDGAKD